MMKSLAFMCERVNNATVSISTDISVNIYLSSETSAGQSEMGQTCERTRPDGR